MSVISFQIWLFGPFGSGQLLHPSCQHREIFCNLLIMNKLKISTIGPSRAAVTLERQNDAFFARQIDAFA
jgi:hypothetical protein